MNGSEPSLDGLDLVASLVNQLEPRMQRHSDEELRARTGVFRERVGAGEGLDALLPEAFALAREAAYRTIGQRHFDVQILAGAALHAGRVVEMKDGEGKTLTATLPAYLNALTGQGVHVVTLSDDLARRDAEWMGDIYRFLGLEVGVILGRTPLADRRAAYAADVTYASYQELGYDYLRDNMALSADEVVQRGHALAIVDEADAILVDAARLDLEEVARGLGQAGRLGAVTMLTGPARGLDLPLGRAVDRPAESPPNTEREQVMDAGGLLVLGAERHWSGSGDQRLRGWAGRRGEPGESRFVPSEQDRLLQAWSGRYGDALRTLARVAHRRRVPVLSRLAVQLPARMQRWAEWRRFQRRLPLLEFDATASQSRPSCQRGDSPNARPVSRLYIANSGVGG